jgi:hypothetical protein
MANEPKEKNPTPNATTGPAEADDVTAGKGRRDEVGRSGIYPASGPLPEHDAEVVSPGELGHRPRHGETDLPVPKREE